MPPRAWRLRIEDMREAIARIERYTAGMTYEAFQASEITVDAVVRNLEIIGEAASQVPPNIRGRHSGLPWDEMRGMRNVVAHVYFGVSLPIIWQTLTHNLPELKSHLDALLAVEEEDAPPE